MTAVQTAIINALRNDAATYAALGSPVAANKGIAESQNFQVGKQFFPFVAVGITTEKPMAAQQTALFGGKRITEVYAEVHVFSKKMTSSESGTIEQSCRQLLDGKNLTQSGLSCYLCEFDSQVQRERDPDSGLWHTVTRYHIIARLT